MRCDRAEGLRPRPSGSAVKSAGDRVRAKKTGFGLGIAAKFIALLLGRERHLAMRERLGGRRPRSSVTHQRCPAPVDMAGWRAIRPIHSAPGAWPECNSQRADSEKAMVRRRGLVGQCCRDGRWTRRIMLKWVRGRDEIIPSRWWVCVAAQKPECSIHPALPIRPSGPAKMVCPVARIYPSQPLPEAPIAPHRSSRDRKLPFPRLTVSCFTRPRTCFARDRSGAVCRISAAVPPRPRRRRRRIASRAGIAMKRALPPSPPPNFG